MNDRDLPAGLTALDRPNSYIGRSVPRPNLARLAQGRGQYVSDVVLPRMAHAAFVRSPHAHARIKQIKVDAAKRAPGLIAVVTGAELAKVCTPWVGVLTHLKGIKSAPQHAIAVERARRWSPWRRARARSPRMRPSWSKSHTRSCPPSPTRRRRSTRQRR
jgi:aerobic carbon-monoxide dehydrogenase large subunit